MTAPFDSSDAFPTKCPRSFSFSAQTYSSSSVPDARSHLIWIVHGLAGRIRQDRDAPGQTGALCAPARVAGRPDSRIPPPKSRACSWIFDLAERKTARVDTGDGSYGQPIWTPDGRFLALGGIRGMAWVRADGTGPAKQLVDAHVIQTPSSFAPDGKRLAFLQFDPSTGLDLWTVPIESTGNELQAGRPEPFLVTGALESQAMFSPDGRWIAYCSTQSGSWEVYVQPFPPDGRKVQVSIGGGRIPFWARNSHDLFYATERQRILKVSYTVRDGMFVPSQLAVWTERPFADTGVIAGVDLAPDGQRFAALMPATPADQQQSPNHVTLLLNFFGEVERRVTAH